MGLTDTVRLVVSGMDTYRASMRWLAVISALFIASGCHPSTPRTFFDWGVQEEVGFSGLKSKKISTTVDDKGRNEKFVWPVEGDVVSSFNLQSVPQNAGIDIAVPAGTPIRASSAGMVIYVGNDLSSYGNLLLIEHSSVYVTAYAHAQRYVVQKGDRIKGGQVVGFSGGTDGKKNSIHFEMRRSAKPVNPLTLLPAKR